MLQFVESFTGVGLSAWLSLLWLLQSALHLDCLLTTYIRTIVSRREALQGLMILNLLARGSKLWTSDVEQSSVMASLNAWSRLCKWICRSFDCRMQIQQMYQLRLIDLFVHSFLPSFIIAGKGPAYSRSQRWELVAVQCTCLGRGGVKGKERKRIYIAPFIYYVYLKAEA